MKNILIADDSVFMRSMIRQILIKNGYNIAGEASNGKQAFEMYKEMKPDVVTLDITMDVMTGIEALRGIMQYDKSAKVIMMSAMGQASFVKEAILYGAKDFLVKPFDEKKVITVIERVLYG